MKSYDLVIIGAGLSGLLLAKSAVAANKTVCLLEKSKGVGGRLATRRIENQNLDHGLQWIADFPEISSELQIWENNKWIEKTPNGFIAPNGMTSLAKHLASGLDIIKSERVSKITRFPQWTAETESGESYTSPVMVITAPLPQAAELLAPSLLLPFTLSKIIKDHQYDKTLIGIFVFESIPDDLHSFEKDGDKFILMKEKSLAPNIGLYILNTKKTLSIYSQSDSDCLEFVKQEMEKNLSHKLNFTHHELKRWRYSLPQKAITSPYLEVQHNLFLIGDSFLYPDIRGSILSAKSLGQYLYQS